MPHTGLDLWRNRVGNVDGVSGRGLLLLGNDVFAQSLLGRRLHPSTHFPKLAYLGQTCLLELLVNGRLVVALIHAQRVRRILMISF